MAFAAQNPIINNVLKRVNFLRNGADYRNCGRVNEAIIIKRQLLPPLTFDGTNDLNFFGVELPQLYF
jgi:hypothetical protein